MSKAIQSMDTVISGVAVRRGGAGNSSRGDEAGDFSRLLSAGQTPETGSAGSQNVPDDGKKLPDESPRQSATDNAERETEPASTVVDAGPAAAPQQTAAPVPSGEALAGDTGQPAELPVEVPADQLAVEEAVAGLADVTGGPADAANAAPEAVNPVSPAVAQATARAGSSGVDPATAGAPVDNAVITPQVAGEADTADVLEAQDTTDHLRVAEELADGLRSRPSADPVGVAVRSGLMQMLALRSAPGSGGDTLGAGGNEPPTMPEQPVAPASAAAGSVAFADTLLEAGSFQHATRIAVPVGQSGWGRAVGEQVVWLVSQNIQSASLKLNPRHLGPLELQLHMEGDRASIAFASQHATVRDALESSMPRLRDMFAEQGLNLVNVNVSQQETGGGRDPTSGAGHNGSHTPATGADGHAHVAVGMSEAGAVRGLVDCYV